MIYKSLKNVIGIKIKVIKDGTGLSIKKNLYSLPLVEQTFLRKGKARKNFVRLKKQIYRMKNKKGKKQKF